MQIKNVLVVGLSIALTATGAPVQDPAGSGVESLEKRHNHNYPWFTDGPDAPLKKRILSEIPWEPNGPDAPLEKRHNHNYPWFTDGPDAPSQ